MMPQRGERRGNAAIIRSKDLGFPPEVAGGDGSFTSVMPSGRKTAHEASSSPAPATSRRRGFHPIRAHTPTFASGPHQQTTDHPRRTTPSSQPSRASTSPCGPRKPRPAATRPARSTQTGLAQPHQAMATDPKPPRHTRTDASTSPHRILRAACPSPGAARATQRPAPRRTAPPLRSLPHADTTLPSTPLPMPPPPPLPPPSSALRARLRARQARQAQIGPARPIGSAATSAARDGRIATRTSARSQRRHHPRLRRLHPGPPARRPPSRPPSPPRDGRPPS